MCSEHNHMRMRGRLQTVVAAIEYINGGNATVTLVSKVTQDRRTFRVRESDDGRLFFVSALTGQNNDTDYQYLGTVCGHEYRHGRKSRIGADAPAAKAFAWFFAGLTAFPERVFEQVEVWHEGRCGRCGRKLTAPESVESGFGPECRQRAALTPGSSAASELPL